MSHYAVLVIGENIKEQLAKFDENLETERYVEYTKEELIKKGRKRIEDYKNNYYVSYLNDPVKYENECKNEDHMKYLIYEFPLKLKWTDEEVYIDGIEYEEAENIGPDGEIYSTRNPNSKWDWYTIGGRYRDRLALKNSLVGVKGDTLEKYVGSLYRESKEGYCDSALKKDIDWSKSHQIKEEYDSAIRFWEIKIEGSEPITDEEKEDVKFDWYKPEYYTDKYKTKEVYATCMSNFTMWSIVIDGKWYEKGEMGWFGVSDESGDEGLLWELNFYDKFIKDLSEDTLLTVVDCHI